MSLESVPFPELEPVEAIFARHLAAPDAPDLEIIRLAPDCMSFSTGRYTYTATDTLCPMRYKAMQKLQIEFGADSTFKGVVEFGQAMREAMRVKDDYAQAVLHNNFMKGIANAAEGRNNGMLICALFFNLPGENQRAYNHELMLAKVRDWELSGIDQQFFFQRAADLVPAFAQNWNALSQIFLENPLP